MKNWEFKNQPYIQRIRFFYLILSFLVFYFGLAQFMKISTEAPITESGILSLLNGWPYTYTSIAIALAMIAVSVLAAFYWESQILRISVVVFFFIFKDLFNSFGTSNNLFQFWFWAAILFSFIPSLYNKKESTRFFYLSWGTWGAKGIVLLFYGLSGLWKIIGFFSQWVKSEEHIFTMKGLSYHLASEIIRAGRNPIFKDFILQNTALNPLLMLTVVLTQLFCFVAIVKPQFMKPAGLMLLLFHIGSFLTLSISFPTGFLLVLVLLLF